MLPQYITIDPETTWVHNWTKGVELVVGWRGQGAMYARMKVTLVSIERDQDVARRSNPQQFPRRCVEVSIPRGSGNRDSVAVNNAALDSRHP